MLDLIGLKTKVIMKIIVILLIPIILICISVGIIVLLAKLEIIPSSSSSSSSSSSTQIGNVTINMSNEVKELISNTDEATVWKELTGGVLTGIPDSYLPSNADKIEAAVEAQIVSIDVPVRKWADSSSMQRIETTQSIEVNSYLKQFWLEFFQNVFNNDPNFVIQDLGCFRIDSVNGSSNIGYKSGHTYGAAVDVNPSENPYGGTAITKEEWEKLEENHMKYQTIYIDSPIVQVARQFTLKWGGDFRNTKDLMHFSFVCDGASRADRIKLIQ